ncbi:SPOR domain-containing protein [Escherichia coli]
MVQVGAVSDQACAQQYQQQLGQKFGVPGRVTQNGAVWRIQLGPFASKADAVPCSNVCKPKPNYSHLLPPRSSVKQASDASISVNDVNKVTRKSDACR